MEEGHYARKDIHKRLEELELSWQALIAASADKKDRLQDAHQVGTSYCPSFLLPFLFPLIMPSLPSDISLPADLSLPSDLSPPFDISLPAYLLPSPPSPARPDFHRHCLQWVAMIWK